MTKLKQTLIALLFAIAFCSFWFGYAVGTGQTATYCRQLIACDTDFDCLAKNGEMKFSSAKQIR